MQSFAAIYPMCAHPPPHHPMWVAMMGGNRNHPPHHPMPLLPPPPLHWLTVTIAAIISSHLIPHCRTHFATASLTVTPPYVPSGCSVNQGRLYTHMPWMGGFTSTDAIVLLLASTRATPVFTAADCSVALRTMAGEQLGPGWETLEQPSMVASGTVGLVK